MKKETKAKESAAPKVIKKYIVRMGYNSFKYVTVYSNFSIAIGAEQKFDNVQGFIEVVP